MGAAMHGSRPWRRRRKPAVFGLFPLLAMMWAVADGQQLRGQETGGAKGGSSGAGCKNTVQGRYMLADDKGKVCEWDGVDGEGCCAQALPDSCKGCDMASSCCFEFEFCVACCQQSNFTKSGEWRKEFRTPGKESTGRWDDAFEFCRGKCRTNSKSTVHENTYLSWNHHCFGVVAFPSPTPPPLAALPASTVAVAGKPGQSCTAACAEAKGTCTPTGLALLNSCDWLRHEFACEAGCDEDGGDANPSYISGPSLDTSAKCLTARSASGQQPAFNCDVSNGAARRLCACEKTATA